MFISHADFTFPTKFIEFLNKHIYIWIFQNGALNFDGIMRLPGRIPLIIVYGLFDDITASYFYIFLCYLVVGISFYFFLREILKVSSVRNSIVISIVYALNPIFLSNTSKIGLIAAVGLLPICIIAIQKFFKFGSIKYLLLLIFCLNYSLIHPYTFSVNLAICILYFLFEFYRNKHHIHKYIPKLILSLIIGVLLHIYLLLPILYVGSLSKNILSSDIGGSEIDYTGIVNISNAGGNVNTLSYTKNVFLDYEYFDENTKIIYTISTFIFYILAYGLFIRLKKQMSVNDRTLFIVSSTFTLLFLFLSSGHYIATKLIIELINLPFGWIFRSPLKWQLYIPIFLFCMIAICFKYIKVRLRIIFTTLILFAGLIQSEFLLYKVFFNLIVPREVHTFDYLRNLPPNSRILLLSGETCIPYLNENLDKLNELNSILVSNYWQVKRTSISGFSNINLDDYDNILVCRGDGSINTDVYNFEYIVPLDNQNFTLYSKENVYAAKLLPELFYLENSNNVPSKKKFVESTLGEEFNFTLNRENATKELFNIFENINYQSFFDGQISTSVELDANKNYELISEIDTFSIKNQQPNISISEADPTLVPTTRVSINNTKKLVVKLKNDENKYASIVSNGGFDSGLWQDSVEDCYNYDNNPIIQMTLGDYMNNPYLSLKAANHIACTSSSVVLKSETPLFFTYSFNSLDTKVAKIAFQFNDVNRSIYSFVARQEKNNFWTNYSNTLDVPEGSSEVKIILYGYPNSDGTFAVTNYDNLLVIEKPEIFNNLFLTSESTKLPTPEITSQVISPVETITTFSGVKDQVLVKYNDSYDRNWILKSNDNKFTLDPIQVNEFSLGFYIETNSICSITECQRNSDGSYEIRLIKYYEPQQKFIYGLFISFITFILIVVVYVFNQNKRRNKKHHLISGT